MPGKSSNQKRDCNDLEKNETRLLIKMDIHAKNFEIQTEEQEESKYKIKRPESKNVKS